MKQLERDLFNLREGLALSQKWLKKNPDSILSKTAITFYRMQIFKKLRSKYKPNISNTPAHA